MARRIHFFDPPDRFVAGTVGPAGQRTFFLQARDSTRVTSVALEKVQVQLLAEKIDEMLDELIADGTAGVEIPGPPPPDEADTDPLDQPLVEEFRVGNLRLGWHTDSHTVVVEAFNGAEDEAAETPVDDDDREALVVRLTPRQARGFAHRAGLLVSAGRPSCPFCAQPLDPSGHVCPRMNGYRRRP